MSDQTWNILELLLKEAASLRTEAALMAARGNQQAADARSAAADKLEASVWFAVSLAAK